MPSLDNRGAVGAAFVGAYAPIAVVTFILIIRYALKRDAGWLWLNIFSLSTFALAIYGLLAVLNEFFML